MSNNFDFNDFKDFKTLFTPYVKVNSEEVEYAPIDLVSNQDSYELWINMPGFDKTSIEVTLQDKVLKIEGKKPFITKPTKNVAISRRPTLENVCYQVRLKTPIDVKKTENSLTAGVFYLKLYKSQPDDGVRIQLS
jgi:HSP20 family molecular chaperone IbpA